MRLPCGRKIPCNLVTITVNTWIIVSSESLQCKVVSCMVHQHDACITVRLEAVEQCGERTDDGSDEAMNGDHHEDCR